ncbi:MAG TPA: hypothetical protein VH439_10440 [Gemmatimonadales bacterium]|jgi:hypothetical protein
MTIDQLVPLTDGLSVTACAQTLALDRTRVTAISDRAIDLSFRIAGTDYAPRIRLTRQWLAASSLEELVAIVRRVAKHTVRC